MAYYMVINMSGKNLAIYQGWPYPDKGSQIGTIYNREAFCYSDTEDGCEVYFRNSSGRLVRGYYYGYADNAGQKALTPCIDYPTGTVRIGGTSYYTFTFRRSEEVYTAAGNRWGTVASGMRVACRTDATGESHPDWKLINYVERSTDGEWVKVTGDGYEHGFVDIGLNVGATPTTISMYGTW